MGTPVTKVKAVRISYLGVGTATATVYSVVMPISGFQVPEPLAEFRTMPAHSVKQVVVSLIRGGMILTENGSNYWVMPAAIIRVEECDSYTTGTGITPAV